MNGISIIVCTRNRPDDLKNLAVHSILEAQKELKTPAVEVIIVDDGDLGQAYLSQLEGSLSKQGISFVYMNKSDRPSTLLSKVESVPKATHEIILFIDDDTAIEKDYLVKLMETYRNNPAAAGIAGIDLMEPKKTRWQKIYQIIIGQRSLNPGRLSISGYPSTKDRWPLQTKMFETEFLLGGNMSFKKSALADLVPNDRFVGYGLGDDLYVAFFARLHGKLFINPDMKIRHYYSSVASDPDSEVYGSRSEQYYYSLIMNHYELHKVYGFPFYRRLCLLYTALGFLLPACAARVIEMPRKRKAYVNKCRGYWRGIKELSQNLLKELFKTGNQKKDRSY